jgi:hypothetical protein
MSTMSVSLVPSEYAKDVWPAVKEYVAKAVKLTSGKYEPEDVLDLVVRYKYPLWIAFDGTDIKGAVITRFIEYPRKKYLFLEFCGGQDGFSWKEPMLSVLRSWAKDNGCDGIEGAGRDGWQKVFEDDGYVPTLRHFEMPVEQEK